MRNSLRIAAALLALPLQALAGSPSSSGLAAAQWTDVVTKSAASTPNCKAGDSIGGACHMTNTAAAKYCADAGMHLPSSREVAAKAIELGAKGTLESAYAGLSIEDHRAADEDQSMAQQGYRQLNYLLPAGGEKAVDFYYNSSGYQAPGGLNGTEEFWFLTDTTSPLHFNVWSGRTGAPGSLWGSEKAVRCVAGVAVALPRSTKNWPPETVVPPAELVGTSWKIAGYASPLAEFGDNPASESQERDAAELRQEMIGNSLDFSAAGPDKCQWKSVELLTAGKSSNLDNLYEQTFPQECGKVRPFKKVYLMKSKCEPGATSITDFGFLDDNTAVAYDGTIWLCLKKPAGRRTKAAAPAAPPANVPAPAPDDADCTLDPQGLAPVMDAKSPALKQYLGAKKGPKNIEESAVLADGTTVTFSSGGCDHLAYSFTYEHVPPPPTADKAAWISLALSLLEETPVRPPGVEKKRLLDALKQGEGASDLFIRGASACLAEKRAARWIPRQQAS